MYPVHHSTLKIEQAERQADAARWRLAAGSRRPWWSWRPRPTTTSAPGGAGPAPMPSAPTPAPVPVSVPGGSAAAVDDRVLVGN